VLTNNEKVFTVSSWQRFDEQLMVTGHWGRIRVLSINKTSNKVIGWDVINEQPPMEAMKEISVFANIETDDDKRLLRQWFIIKAKNINE